MKIQKKCKRLTKISILIIALIFPVLTLGILFAPKQSSNKGTEFYNEFSEDILSLSGGDDTLDWGVDDIDAERVWGPYEDANDVWPEFYAGQNVKVLVIDSGMDLDHSDLAGNYKKGINIQNPDSSPEDNNGHGTKCAGIIGAIDNGFGVIGVAPKVDLYIAEIYWGPDYSKGLNQLKDAISWGRQNDVDVISISQEFEEYDYTLESVCDLAVYGEEIVIVAAAGNYYEGVNEGIQYPANFSSTIAVGAIDEDHYRWDEWNEYGKHLGSNYGPELDLVAPGVEIYTTTINNGYTKDSGTSMACPMVAGVCALLLSKDPSLKPWDISYILKHTADSSSIPDYNENEYGWGMVNASAAYNSLKTDFTPPSVTITNPSDGYPVSGSIAIRADASDNKGIYKVLCKIGSKPWKTMYKDSSGYWYSWNTRERPNGYTCITCRVFDDERNWADDTITVRVDNDDGGGGGGCPILSVFDGEAYVEEGLLNIHNPDGIDVITHHSLIAIPEPIANRYLLKLTEHHKTISHIDQVKFYGRIPNGKLIPLYLSSATHSSLGEVRWELWISDDIRVDELGADHNEGISEFITLEFIAPAHKKFIEFIFVIEGNNAFVK